MAAAQTSIAVPPAGKCAGPIPAENCANAQKIQPATDIYVMIRDYFLHEVQFSAAIGAAHFLAETTRPLGRGCLHFHLTFLFVKWQWE